jgi:hypothetical protein
MSDRRTFLGNAAAAAVIAKISPLRSFGFTSDGPETIHPTMSDREKAGLRGPVSSTPRRQSSRVFKAVPRLDSPKRRSTILMEGF